MTTKTDASMVLAQSAKIIDAHSLLKTPVSELTPDAQITAWSVLDMMEKALISPRKAELRLSLLDYAKTEGEANKNGSMSVPLGGGKVTAQKKGGKVEYNITALQTLLKVKGIQATVIREVKSYEVDEKAIESLLGLNLISLAELKSCTSVGESSFTLIVAKPPKVLALLPEPQE